MPADFGILRPPPRPPTSGGIGVNGSGNSTVNVDGGSITGGAASGSAGGGGDALRSTSGAVNLLDGSVTGGTFLAGDGSAFDRLLQASGSVLDPISACAPATTLLLLAGLGTLPIARRRGAV